MCSTLIIQPSISWHTEEIAYRIFPDYANAIIIRKTDNIILSKSFLLFHLGITILHNIYDDTVLKYFNHFVYSCFILKKITDITKNKRRNYSVGWIWKVCRLFVEMRSTNYYYFANDYYKRYQLIHAILKLSRALSSIILLLKFRLFVVGSYFIAVKCYTLNYTVLSPIWIEKF